MQHFSYKEIMREIMFELSEMFMNECCVPSWGFQTLRFLSYDNFLFNIITAVLAVFSICILGQSGLKMKKPLLKNEWGWDD